MSIRINGQNQNGNLDNVFKVSSVSMNIGKGGTSGGGGVSSEYNTTQYWNSRKDYIPKKGTIVVYSDGIKNEDGTYTPRFKFADGTTYLIDLPFCDNEDELQRHIADMNIHVTPEEKTEWNKAITVTANENDECLIIKQVITS